MPKILNMDSRKVQSEKSSDFIKELRELEKYRQRDEFKKPTIVVEFSWKFILGILLLLSMFFLGKELLTVFIFLFGGFVFMSTARPVVTFLMGRKIGKGFSVTITYFLGLVLLAAVLSIVVFPFIDQIDELVSAVPKWVDLLSRDFGDIVVWGYTIDTSMINSFVRDALERFTLVDSFENIANTVGSLFSSTALVFASVIFSIYLVLDHDNILELGLVRIISDAKRKRVKELVLEVENKLGRWLLGQALISSIAGLVMGIVLWVLGVPFALPIAVFVALMSAIPNLGATIGSIPPIFIAMVVKGPLAALIIIVVFFIYQQLENNIIGPKIMCNVMGVRPIFIMFTAVNFFILFGVWGAVLAVPAIVVMRICYEFYIDLQKLKAKGSI